MKNKIITVFVVFLLVSLGVFQFLTTRTVYNDDSALGNTSGNLMNHGLFCEYDQKIYFSNSNDDGCIYVMNSDLSHLKKISSDTADNINVAGKYIIYCRKNNKKQTDSGDFFNFNNTGMYRIDRSSGNHIKPLYEKAVGTLNLAGNYVYYEHYDEKKGVQLYQTKIDEKEGSLLSENDLLPFAIQNGFLYYTEVKKNHNICRMDLATGSSQVLLEGNFSHLILNNEHLYYFDLNNNHAITRANLDGSDPTVLVKQSCSTYNVSNDGKFLYYQIDDGKSNSLQRYDIAHQENILLLEGNYKNINVTSNYIFFQDFDTEQTYYLSSGQDITVTKFTEK